MYFLWDSELQASCVNWKVVQEQAFSDSLLDGYHRYTHYSIPTIRDCAGNTKMNCSTLTEIGKYSLQFSRASVAQTKKALGIMLIPRAFNFSPLHHAKLCQGDATPPFSGHPHLHGKLLHGLCNVEKYHADIWRHRLLHSSAHIRCSFYGQF